MTNYITLSEVSKTITGSDKIIGTKFMKNLADYLSSYFGTTLDFNDTEEANEFYDYAFAYYGYEYYFSAQNTESYNSKTMNRLYQIFLEMTKNMNSIIRAYKKDQEELESGLVNKTITKFNDTPTEEGDFGTDKYTSTISSTTNEQGYGQAEESAILRNRIKFDYFRKYKLALSFLFSYKIEGDF